MNVWKILVYYGKDISSFPCCRFTCIVCDILTSLVRVAQPTRQRKDNATSSRLHLSQSQMAASHSIGEEEYTSREAESKVCRQLRTDPKIRTSMSIISYEAGLSFRHCLLSLFAPSFSSRLNPQTVCWGADQRRLCAHAIVNSHGHVWEHSLSHQKCDVKAHDEERIYLNSRTQGSHRWSDALFGKPDMDKRWHKSVAFTQCGDLLPDAGKKMVVSELDTRDEGSAT